MKPLNKKILIVILTTAIFLHSMQGCRATKPPDDGGVSKSIAYVDVATYPFPKQKIIEAINRLLPKRGFMLSQIESNDSTLVADYWSDEIMIEEYRDILDKQSRPTFLSSLLTFLGIILLVGLVVASLSSSEDNDVELSSAILDNENNKAVYNYRVFMDIKALNDSTTDVAIDIQKITIKNDVETESIYLENKYLNHSMIYGIDSCLRK